MTPERYDGWRLSCQRFALKGRNAVALKGRNAVALKGRNKPAQGKAQRRPGSICTPHPVCPERAPQTRSQNRTWTARPYVPIAHIIALASTQELAEEIQDLLVEDKPGSRTALESMVETLTFCRREIDDSSRMKGVSAKRYWEVRNLVDEVLEQSERELGRSE